MTLSKLPFQLAFLYFSFSSFSPSLESIAWATFLGCVLQHRGQMKLSSIAIKRTGDSPNVIKEGEGSGGREKKRLVHAGGPILSVVRYTPHILSFSHFQYQQNFSKGALWPGSSLWSSSWGSCLPVHPLGMSQPGCMTWRLSGCRHLPMVPATGQPLWHSYEN
jgi:hypothetical protein